MSSKHRFNGFVLLIVLSVMLTGCFFGSGVKTIDISAVSAEVEQGKSIDLEAKGSDGKKEVNIVNVVWTIDDESKGTITQDATNERKAIFTAGADAEGKVVVTATAGRSSGTLELLVKAVGVTPGEFDKKELAAAITEAGTLANDTGVGIKDGQVPEAAMTALQTAIDAAKVVNADAQTTQKTVNTAESTLKAAIADFNAAIWPVTVFLYQEDYTGATEPTGWESLNYAAGLKIAESDDPKYGEHFNVILDPGVNSRGMHYYFPEVVQTVDKLVIDLDVKMKKGTKDSVQFALLGTTDDAWTNVDWGVDKKWVATLSNTKGMDEWVINSPGDNPVVVPNMTQETWVNVRVVMNFEDKSTVITVKDAETGVVLIQENAQMANDVESLCGMYFCAGRNNSAVALDNIKLYDQIYLRD